MFAAIQAAGSARELQPCIPYSASIPSEEEIKARFETLRKKKAKQREKERIEEERTKRLYGPPSMPEYNAKIYPPMALSGNKGRTGEEWLRRVSRTFRHYNAMLVCRWERAIKCTSRELRVKSSLMKP